MTVQLSQTASCTLEDLVIPPGIATKLRRADDFIRLGVAGAAAVYDPASGEHHAERIGLIVGSCFGPMQTNFDVLEQIVSKEQTSPTLFSHSVFNGATGYIAASLNIRGVGQTITDFTLPFFQSLREGWFQVENGEVDGCLVLQIETYSSLLEDGRNEAGNEKKEWPPGVVCWLLEKQEICRKPGVTIGLPEIDLLPEVESTQILFPTERLMIGEWSSESAHPLGSAVALSNWFQDGGVGNNNEIKLAGDCGKVLIPILADSRK